MSNAKRKAQLLGMPFGTANGRLKKMLLFKLAGALGWLGCYRCDQGTIKSIEDFSIEHKEAWLTANDPVKAFFDLDNIAFSHIKCNIKAGTVKAHCSKGHKYTDDNTRIRTTGTRMCRICNRYRLGVRSRTDEFREKRKSYPSRKRHKRD